jgi:hypothetical protein
LFQFGDACFELRNATIAFDAAGTRRDVHVG